MNQELEQAERELQEDSDRSMQMLVLVILLTLIVAAIFAGWLL